MKYENINYLSPLTPVNTFITSMMPTVLSASMRDPFSTKGGAWGSGAE